LIVREFPYAVEITRREQQAGLGEDTHGQDQGECETHGHIVAP
jgi:hypothetical protein